MTEAVTILVDADIVAYQFASAVQKNYQWPNGVASVDITKSDKEIIENVDDYLLTLKDYLEADRMIVCLSDPDVNFRKSVLPSYKGHRDPNAKPQKLMWLKGVLADKYETFQRPTLEADDVMGILSTHPKLIPGKKIIVSEDKDMKTIPGWLFNPAKHTEPVYIEEHDADYYHLYQTITGDPTDGYKGCPNAGAKAAEQALKDGDECRHFSVTEMWQRTVAVYEAAKEKGTKKPLGLTEKDALVQARCARILRHTDYDFKRKKVKLWLPPKAKTT